MPGFLSTQWTRSKRGLRSFGRAALIIALFTLMAVVGWIVAWGGSHLFGGQGDEEPNDVVFLELRNVDPTDPAQGMAPSGVIEITDAETISISLFTTVQSLGDGAAEIVIYDYPANGKSKELHRLESQSGQWSRWDFSLDASRIAIVVNPPRPGSGTPATDVDVIVYVDVEDVAKVHTGTATVLTPDTTSPVADAADTASGSPVSTTIAIASSPMIAASPAPPLPMITPSAVAATATPSSTPAPNP